MKKIKKETLTSKDRNDPILSSKRLAYLIVTPLSVVSIIFVWGFYSYVGEISWIDQYALPIIAYIMCFLMIFLWSKLISLRSFEYLAYCLIFIYISLKIFFQLRGVIVDDLQIESNFLLWVTFIYILGFCLLEIRRALAGSLIFLLLVLAFGVGFFSQSNTIVVNIPKLQLLFEVFLVSIFSIILLYLMAHTGEHYNSTRLTANFNSKLANTDSLTMMDNRRQLERHLNEEINRADRHNLPLAIIMFDIDHFKRINDEFGHALGDLVLVKSARIVRNSLRSSDHFGRWGGDEFVCVATNTDEETAVLLAERLRTDLEQAPILKSSPITCSFGVTRFISGDTPEDLIRRADQGLLQAKENGRNQVVAIPSETPMVG